MRGEMAREEAEGTISYCEMRCILYSTARAALKERLGAIATAKGCPKLLNDDSIFFTFILFSFLRGETG
jgi:hypothetical protein